MRNAFHSALFWVFAGATLATFLAMHLGTVPAITAGHGLELLDTRTGGYSFAEVKTFLEALGPHQTEIYTTIQRIIDTIFPVAYAGTIALAIFGAAPPRLGLWRFGFATLPLVAAAFDLLENHEVSGLLLMGPNGISPANVEQASTYTNIKFFLVLLSLATFAALLVARQLVGSPPEES